MAAHPASAPVDQERDPIADARALVAMAIGLGQRARTAHRLGLVTDRKAALYVSTLVRHAARLLQSASTHDVPVLRSSSTGPGGNAVHFVVRHDRVIGPPSASRLLVVGSDARLRCCIVADHGGARIWADYDVATAPEGLSLRTVLDALSEIIARLEQSVIQLETRELVREAQLEADIAAAKARIAGLPVDAPMVSRRHARSEEPVRPWTRHVATEETADTGTVAVPDDAGERVAPETSRWARPVTMQSGDDGRKVEPEYGVRAERTATAMNAEGAEGAEGAARAGTDRAESAAESDEDLVFVMASEPSASAAALVSHERPDELLEVDGHAGSDVDPGAADAPKRGFSFSRLHKLI